MSSLASRSSALPVQPGARRAAELAHARGAETRRRILEAAVELGSSEGLEPLTLGKLAEQLAMSKAGLFAHFGSKEELQLATVEAARALFVERVFRPALEAPEGLPRLHALCERWLHYSLTLPGGCFFAAAAAEFDGRPGPVRDRVAEILREWLVTLERSVVLSQQAGHVFGRVDAAQVAFELNALALGSNQSRQLFEDREAVARSRTAMLEKIRSIATQSGKKTLQQNGGRRG